MNCPNCQRPVREGAQFCTNCGTRTSRDDEPSADSVPPSAEAVPTIENPAGGAAETSANRGTETEPDGDPLLGRVLDGKYEIIAPLGAGGMGSVYRARRVLIGDEVAVKVLHTKFVNDDTLVARFRREARAAAQLHHPNVVTIHDYGEARGPRGFAYIVMELVRGDSLRALIRREGRMDVARAVSLMRDVCAGVGAAHRRGIVHRDIKPDNIIVVPADEDAPTERVKVVDFGIAKLRDMASDGTLTEEGDVVGTPYYMSPEQCHGEHLDVRADVYSLGALLYEMLAGIWPFNAPSLAGIILKHVSEPPPPLPPDVPAPPALSDAIARALSKVPDERQRDATEFAREIQAAAVAPASRSTHEPHVLPFSETTRPAPVTPLPARDQNPAPTPTPPLPLTRPDVLSDTRPHTPAALTHGGARRKRSRAPLVLGLLALLLVGAAALAFVGYTLMRSSKKTVVVNSRPTPAPTAVNTNNANANASPTPSPVLVSEQMMRAEQKIVAGTALKGEEIAGLTTQQLRLLRNAVFARYGRVFDAGELQQYFQSRPWYRARRDFNEKTLTEIDRANTDLLKAYEDNNGAPPKFDASEVSKGVAEALDAWADATRARDLDAQMRAYADTLEVFYKKTNVPVSQVKAERATAFKRYDSLDVQITNVEVEPSPSGRRAIATFDKSWEFQSNDKTATGRVRQQLTFVKQGDRWLITGERDLQVYETGSEEY